MINTCVETKIHMLLVLLVLLGGINWGTTAFGYNLVEILSNNLNKLFNINQSFDKIIYIIICGAALSLAMKRDMWLPFLGKTVLPASLISNKVPEKTDFIVKARTLPNSKVAYWSALNKNEKQSVEEAYDDYSNSGVVMSDKDGNVEFPILTGGGYIVPSGRFIPRHVHYRVLGLKYGMIGEVKTVSY